jgi:hypothetical protein
MHYMVSFMSLTGVFRTVRVTPYGSLQAAKYACAEHAAAGGYTGGIKLIDDGDGAYRVTSNPPSGPRGRNIAVIEPDVNYDEFYEPG